MDEQFLYDFRTGCGNSAKFARIFDMGFIYFSLKSFLYKKGGKFPRNLPLSYKQT